MCTHNYLQGQERAGREGDDMLVIFICLEFTKYSVSHAYKLKRERERLL